MHQQKNLGFTLMELMIVVAIVGILASIAVPSYGRYVTDARRLDGQIALRNAAQFMERCRTQSFTYVNCDTSARAPTSSEESHYDLDYTNVTGTTFTITAEPPTGSKQAGDTECATLTIDQTGAVDSTPASTADGVCW